MDVWGQFHAPIFTPGENKPVPDLAAVPIGSRTTIHLYVHAVASVTIMTTLTNTVKFLL
jgi:hypothetical protein